MYYFTHSNRGRDRDRDRDRREICEAKDSVSQCETNCTSLLAETRQGTLRAFSDAGHHADPAHVGPLGPGTRWRILQTTVLLCRGARKPCESRGCWSIRSASETAGSSSLHVRSPCLHNFRMDALSRQHVLKYTRKHLTVPSSHSFVPSLYAEQNFEENRQFNLYRKTMESLGNNGCFWVIVSTLFSVLVIFLAVSSLTRLRPSPRIPAQSRLL